MRKIFKSVQTFCHCIFFSKENTGDYKWQKLSRTRGFIDRSPLQIVASIFILAVGIFVMSIPLITLAIFDFCISIAFFSNPKLADKKSFKFPVFFLYGLILLWCAFWLMYKIS